MRTTLKKAVTFSRSAALAAAAVPALPFFRASRPNALDHHSDVWFAFGRGLIPALRAGPAIAIVSTPATGPRMLSRVVARQAR
jgi:hypothetical protein